MFIRETKYLELLQKYKTLSENFEHKLDKIKSLKEEINTLNTKLAMLDIINNKHVITLENLKVGDIFLYIENDQIYKRLLIQDDNGYALLTYDLKGNIEGINRMGYKVFLRDVFEYLRDNRYYLYKDLSK